MDVELKRPSQLAADERAAWAEFVADDPALASPYFALEFAECCEEARPDTRVIAVRERGIPVGFLPLQAGRVGFARPLAGPLGDVHGVIGEPGRAVDLAGWLKAARIPVLLFHSALARQAAFRPFTRRREGGWIVDISEGFDAWHENRRQINSKITRNIRSRFRRLEDAEGGHRFIMQDERPRAFAQMLAWKREQYCDTGVFDVFSVRWTRRLLEAVLRRRGDRFRGVCSTLEIGGRIAAVHVGMASDRILQYWFPAYDRGLGAISPGLVLMVESFRRAARDGLGGVDLGPGAFAFKKDLASWQVGLAGGYCATAPLAGALRGAACGLSDWAHPERTGAVARVSGKAFRKLDRLTGFYAA
jgi:CelD/BcsL family acetyltransferase involved in cellulose biosynthesis